MNHCGEAIVKRIVHIKFLFKPNFLALRDLGRLAAVRDCSAMRNVIQEIEDIDGQFRSMCVHFHAYHYYVELHLPDIAITDLDTQESELEGKGYFKRTLSCQLICNLKGLLPAEQQAGRPWAFNGYDALQLSTLLAAEEWIREVPCCGSRTDRR